MSNLQVLTSKEMRSQVNRIQEVMKAVMKDGTHYGTIPGCQKPSLYKAGSEILLTTFMIAVEPEVIDLSTEDEAKYRVMTRGVYRDGTVVGIGVGECSSNEEKYKWRAVVCDQEWEETSIDRRREKWFKGKWDNVAKKTGPAYKIKQVRTEIADVANTILKMAKKRSQIDLTLTSTAASDIFTQDIEDMPEELRETGQDVKPRKEAVKPPQAKTETKPQEKTPEEEHTDIPAAQSEVVSSEIPNCADCGLPVASNEADAKKVVEWCKTKKFGAILCRKCQPKN